MARKLSSIAFSVLWFSSAAAVTLTSASAFAQSGVQVSPAGKQVVNPFAAKRQTTPTAEPAAPIMVPPAEVGLPKTYQNPFAQRGATPRFVTPRLQPGPLSRWHRQEQPPALPTEQRPIHAVTEAAPAANDKFDLSGPLAVQEQRTSLFAVPEVEGVKASQSPPDPSRFGSNGLAQPTWLVPDESNTATVSNSDAESAGPARAAAQAPIDPFEAADGEVIVVSDDGPAASKPESAAPILVKPEQAQPVVIQPAEPIVEAPVADVPVAAAPVAPTIPPFAPRDADGWYAQAEQAAAEAASTHDLAAVVHLCQSGLECGPDVELARALRSLAAWACNRSGEIESDQRREDDALKAFELAIQWDPNCWLALHNRAVSRAQQGNLEGALADFNRSLELNPGLAVAYRNRGELLAATGRTEEAVADYTNALAQLPQDADLHAMRGEAYHRLGQYDNALADLSQATEIAPHNATAFSQRGNVYAEVGDYQRAIADFRQALSVDAQSAESHRSLAWLLATCPDQRFRDSRQALASAERAAKLAGPGDPFVLDALAAAHANAGQFDRAVRCQQEALANVPGDFAEPFRARLALYQQQRPFRNGTNDMLDENVRAASLEAAPHSPR